jgi:exodeoxyribonuclease V alpha subunit
VPWALGWQPELWRGLRDSVAGWPEDGAGWRKLLAASEQVWPWAIWISTSRWCSMATASICAATGAMKPGGPCGAPALGGVLAGDASVDTAGIRRWLDMLFPHASRAVARTGRRSPAPWRCAASWASSRAARHGQDLHGGALLALLFATAGSGRDNLRVALAADRQGGCAAQAIDRYGAGRTGQKVGAELPLRELAGRMGAARTLHSLLGARPDTRAFRTMRATS